MWVIRGQPWVHFPGPAGDVLLPADYDGDGDTDIALYRPSTGVWVIRNQPWVHFPAQNGDVLLPADYDGDGDTDIAFYRPSTGVWVIRGQEWVHFPAQAGDVLAAGRLRRRRGHGHRLLPAEHRRLGDPQPAVGALPRPGGDVLLPGDYDGDGDIDIAFYRPSTGVWVIRGQEWVHFPASPTTSRCRSRFGPSSGRREDQSSGRADFVSLRAAAPRPPATGTRGPPCRTNYALARGGGVRVRHRHPQHARRLRGGRVHPAVRLAQRIRERVPASSSYRSSPTWSSSFPSST